MVPVPYIIGTTTDLISELAPSNLEDVYVINIDTKEVSIHYKHMWYGDNTHTAL